VADLDCSYLVGRFPMPNVIKFLMPQVTKRDTPKGTGEDLSLGRNGTPNPAGTANQVTLRISRQQVGIFGYPVSLANDGSELLIRHPNMVG